MSAPKSNRAKAIRECVAARPRGALLSEIIAACEPNWSVPPTTCAERDARDKARRCYGAQVQQLTRKGKLAKVRATGYRIRYFATEMALVDERKRNPALEAPSPAPRKSRAKPGARSRTKRAPVVIAPAVTPRPRLLATPQLGPKRNGVLDSDRIAADVAAFLRRGGRIQKLRQGESSQPLRTMSMHEMHDKTWRDRQTTDAVDDVA